MRKATEEIVLAYHENQVSPIPSNVAALRARLVTSINPMGDANDDLILTHFDELFAGTNVDLNLFTKRMALLLKHDWERVKWECTPIYKKVFTRFTAKQRKWRSHNYRTINP